MPDIRKLVKEKHACAQGAEVLNSFGNNITKEAHRNSTNRFTPDFNIKEAFGCHLGLHL